MESNKRNYIQNSFEEKVSSETLPWFKKNKTSNQNKCKS